MLRRSIYDYFLLALLAAVFYGIAQILSPFAGALLSSLICALTFYPMYKGLHRHFPKLSPTFIAAISDTLVMIFFVVPILLLSWAIVQESTTLIAVLKEGSTTLAQWRSGNLDNFAPWMSRVRFFLASTGIRRAQFQEQVIDWVNEALGYLSLLGTLLAKNAIVFILDLLIMLFALFFMFRDGEKLYHYIEDLIPLRRADKEHMAVRLHDTVTGLVRGMFLTCLIQGVAATVGYAIVGADGSVLLGALTAIMGLVPAIGTFGIWVPAGVFFLLKGSYFKGIFLLCWGALIVVGLIDTLARPYLVGKKAELPMFALFFALLGGVEVWGAKGIFLGPLLVALFPVLLDIYRLRYLRGTENDDKLSEE